MKERAREREREREREEEGREGNLLKAVGNARQPLVQSAGIGGRLATQLLVVIESSFGWVERVSLWFVPEEPEHPAVPLRSGYFLFYIFIFLFFW